MERRSQKLLKVLVRTVVYPIQSRCVHMITIFIVMWEVHRYLILWLWCCSDRKELTCNVGHLDSIPGSRNPWRRAWEHTAVFLPGESHGQRSLADKRPWDQKESDRMEQLTTAPHMKNPGTDVCSHGEFRLHVTWIKDIECLSARKMRKCIYWEFHQVAFLNMRYTCPRFQMKYSRKLHEFLTK